MKIHETQTHVKKRENTRQIKVIREENFPRLFENT